MKLTRNHFNIIYLLFLALFFIVPNALAQDFTVDDVLDALGPRDGDALILDIMLYMIFFMSIITMFLIPDKQLTASLLNFAVLFFAVISKLLVSAEVNDPNAIISPCDLPTLGINAGLFALPLIIAGMVRTRKVGSPPAMFTSIINGLIGGGYFFLFWALAQRTGCDVLSV